MHLRKNSPFLLLKRKLKYKTLTLPPALVVRTTFNSNYCMTYKWHLYHSFVPCAKSPLKPMTTNARYSLNSERYLAPLHGIALEE